MSSSPHVRFAVAIIPISCCTSAGIAGRRTRFPAPKQPESLSVPMDQRLRLHHGQQLPPLEEPRQRHKSDARGVISPARLRLPFQVQSQLLP
jgi:hypothetical protein